MNLWNRLRPFKLPLFLLLTFLPSPSRADDIPDVLDYDRRKAVSHRFEFSPFIGDYFGDKFTHSYIAGGDLQFNITEWLGVASDFGYTQLSADRTSLLGMSITNKNAYLIDGGFVLTMPAAFANKKKTTELDFFSSIGGGVLLFNHSTHGVGYVGGGMKLRPGLKWLAIRVDLRYSFTSINNPSGSDFENGLTIRFGPTFLLPPEM